MREVVLDTETTGLDPKSGHRIVEIGAIELINHIYLIYIISLVLGFCRNNSDCRDGQICDTVGHYCSDGK